MDGGRLKEAMDWWGCKSLSLEPMNILVKLLSLCLHAKVHVVIVNLFFNSLNGIKQEILSIKLWISIELPFPKNW